MIEIVENLFSKSFSPILQFKEGKSDNTMKKVKASLDHTSTFIFLTNEPKETAEKLVPAIMAQLILKKPEETRSLHEIYDEVYQLLIDSKN